MSPSRLGVIVGLFAVAACAPSAPKEPTADIRIAEPPAARCGNGVRELGEQCDEGDNGGRWGHCAPGCVIGPHCGDGVVDPEHEACDDGDPSFQGACSERCAPRRVLSIAVGGVTCARLSDERLKCFGSGYRGLLASGDQQVHGITPEQMGAGLPAVNLGTGRIARDVSVGDLHACAIVNEGRLVCWGNNDWGQLGLGDKLERGGSPDRVGDALELVDLGAGKRVTRVSAGGGHTCAILEGGELKCWGRGEFGELGLGDASHRGDEPGEMGDALPSISLGKGLKAVAVAAGQGHTCAISDDGAVKCWGQNLHGELGRGTRTTRGPEGEVPEKLARVDLGRNRKAVAISVSNAISCALLDDATVKCWGYDAYGQLGQGDDEERGVKKGQMGDALHPIDLGRDARAIAISSSPMHTCALLAGGSMKCWGTNGTGELGLGGGADWFVGDERGEMGDALPAIDLGKGRTATAIGTGYTHTCALLDDGSVKCWGRGDRGETGAGFDEPLWVGDRPGQMGDALPAVKLFGDRW